MNSSCQIIKTSSWQFITKNHIVEYKYKDDTAGDDKQTLQNEVIKKFLHSFA